METREGRNVEEKCMAVAAGCRANSRARCNAPSKS